MGIVHQESGSVSLILPGSRLRKHGKLLEFWGVYFLTSKEKELDHIIREVSSSPTVVGFLAVNLNIMFNALCLQGQALWDKASES